LTTLEASGWPTGVVFGRDSMLYRRGLLANWVNPEDKGPLRIVPEELITSKKDLQSGAESVILEVGGASVFEQIAGEHSVQQDLTATNPNFGTGDPAYTHNCGNCTAALEMRRRGFDVEAMPRILMPVDEWAKLFDGFQQRAPESRIESEVVAELEQNIMQWGEGYSLWHVERKRGPLLFSGGKRWESYVC